MTSTRSIRAVFSPSSPSSTSCSNSVITSLWCASISVPSPSPGVSQRIRLPILYLSISLVSGSALLPTLAASTYSSCRLQENSALIVELFPHPVAPTSMMLVSVPHSFLSRINMSCFTSSAASLFRISFSRASQISSMLSFIRISLSSLSAALIRPPNIVSPFPFPTLCSGISKTSIKYVHDTSCHSQHILSSDTKIPEYFLRDSYLYSCLSYIISDIRLIHLPVQL